MCDASTSWNRPQNAEQIDGERLSIRRQCRSHICSFMDRQSHINGVRGKRRDYSNEKDQKCIGERFKFHRTLRALLLSQCGGPVEDNRDWSIGRASHIRFGTWNEESLPIEGNGEDVPWSSVRES